MSFTSTRRISRTIPGHIVQTPGCPKYDLGLAKDFKHKIHLKTQDPVYRKQFKIREAHHHFIEQTLDEWLKLGVVKRSNSLYNSPIFCIPKKQGQGLRIVQDFRELNQNSHIDKYSMKDIIECIGNNLHHFGPHFRILADAAGRRLTEIDGLYHPRQGPIPLDYISNGTLGLPNQFPKAHGRGAPRHSKCIGLHR